MKLYLVKMTHLENKESFYKVGVTGYRETMHRFTKYGEEHRRIQTGSGSRLEKLRAAYGGHVYDHPYSISEVHEVDFETEANAKTTERGILWAVEAAKYVPLIPFTGWTECFTSTDEQIKQLIEYMNQAAADARNSGAPLED